MKTFLLCLCLCLASVPASLSAYPALMTEKTCVAFYEAKFDDKQLDEIERKMMLHHNSAVEIMHELGWALIDDTECPDILATLIKAAVAGLCPGTPLSKMCVIIATIIQEYIPMFLDMMDDHLYNLYHAQYDFEMCEFYRDVLIYHGRSVPNFEKLYECFPILTDWENDPYEAYHTFTWEKK